VTGDTVQARAALQTSLETFENVDARRERAYAVRWLGFVAPTTEEAQRRYHQALAIFEELRDPRGKLITLWGLGFNAMEQGQYGEAQKIYQDCLDIARHIGFPQAIADSLLYLGRTALDLGEYEQAKRLHRESLTRYREMDDRWGIAASLRFLSGACWSLGEREKAAKLLQECLQLQQQSGNLQDAAIILLDLGSSANALGRYQDAIQYAEESRSMLEGLNPQVDQYRLQVVGEALCGLGDLAGARRCMRQALEMIAAEGRTKALLNDLVGVARLVAIQGDCEKALELVGLIQSHPASAQHTKEKLNDLCAQLEATLPPFHVAKALERGRARDLGPTVTELLKVLDTDTTPAASVSP
jgi:tetratricopeptide (TPR) repeat protein